MLTDEALAGIFNAVDEYARHYARITAGAIPDERWRAGMGRAVDAFIAFQLSIHEAAQDYSGASLCNTENNPPLLQSRGEWHVDCRFRERETQKILRLVIKSGDAPLVHLESETKPAA